MPLIDSHAHLTADALFEQVDPILARAQASGVDAIVNICTDAKTLERGLSLKGKYSWVFHAAATTPHDVEKEGELLFPLMERHALSGALVAVGETGLDYHYYSHTKLLQQDFLRRYLHLALRADLPVIIHCREAFADLFQILDSDYKLKGAHAPGVLHCFTGTAPEAEQLLARGWFISLSGIVTYKKSDALRDVAKIVPLERLLIETDAPYLAPQAYRGQINEPAFILETADTIAKVKGISSAEVANATAANAARLFKINLC